MLRVWEHDWHDSPRDVVMQALQLGADDGEQFAFGHDGLLRAIAPLEFDAALRQRPVRHGDAQRQTDQVGVRELDAGRRACRSSNNTSMPLSRSDW